MEERLKKVEEAVLLTVAMLGEEAYPVRISEELREKTSKVLPVATVHSILMQFEGRGFVNSVIIKSGTGRSKRTKRIYSLSNYGREKNNIPYLRETLENLLQFYHASQNKIQHADL